MGDIQVRTFTRTRKEWWIAVDGQYGGRVEDIYLAANWARQALENRNVPCATGDYEGHIKIKPTDEHVIVYIEFDEEQKP